MDKKLIPSPRLHPLHFLQRSMERSVSVGQRKPKPGLPACSTRATARTTRGAICLPADNPATRGHRATPSPLQTSHIGIARRAFLQRKDHGSQHWSGKGVSSGGGISATIRCSRKQLNHLQLRPAACVFSSGLSGRRASRSGERGT